MITTARLVLALSVATGLTAAVLAPVHAQTTAEAMTAAAAPTLNLSSRPTIALSAAKAAQASKTAATSTDDTVEPVTVTPLTPAKGRVVASTDATSLTSPNFSSRQTDDTLLAVSAGHNMAAGEQSFDNTFSGGFLSVNPQGDATRTTVGLTRVF